MLSSPKLIQELSDNASSWYTDVEVRESVYLNALEPQTPEESQIKQKALGLIIHALQIMSSNLRRLLVYYGLTKISARHSGLANLT